MGIITFLTISGAIDFWFTKNIAGRLMVGLFWERYIHEEDEHFKYECHANEDDNNKFDSRVFWWSQYIAILAWTGVYILNILSIDIEYVSCFFLVNFFLACAAVDSFGA